MGRNGNGKKNGLVVAPVRPVGGHSSRSLGRSGFLPFLPHPDAALWIATADTRVDRLDREVRQTLERMYTFARQLHVGHIKVHDMRAEVTLLLRTQLTRDEARSIGDDAHLYDEMCAAIADCHKVLDDLSRYVPHDMKQLWSSDGVAKNWRTPQELLVGMFFPRYDLKHRHTGPTQDGLDGLRSFVALRTWFMAANWMMQRHIHAMGAAKMKDFTTALERKSFFQPVTAGRIQTHTFRVNREKWFTWTDAPEGHSVTIELSHRMVDVGGRFVRIWFAARLKELAALWGRAHRRNSVHDLIAATFMFESRADYDAALPLVKRVLLRRKMVRAAHVEDEQRTAGTVNPASAGYRGVFWKGIVVVGGVEVELEFAHISRFLDSAYALSVFNHGVYEVRRLMLPTHVDDRSLWELLFPEQYYRRLDNAMIIKMFHRQLFVVASDLYAHNSIALRQAVKTIQRLCRFLQLHPDAILDPQKYPDL